MEFALEGKSNSFQVTGLLASHETPANHALYDYLGGAIFLKEIYCNTCVPISNSLLGSCNIWNGEYIRFEISYKYDYHRNHANILEAMLVSLNCSL